MSLVNTKTTNDDGPFRDRQPLDELPFNHDLEGEEAASIDPRILDDDPEYDEDAEPDSTSASTNGVCHFSDYNIKQMASALLFTCNPDTIHPLKSLNLPHAWIPYLKAVRVRRKGNRVLRDYYPLPEQQKEFDKWKATHPPNVVPGMLSFTLCAIPSFPEEEIPPVPLPYLIMGAIEGSPSSTLTERQIKLALIRRFPYFAERLARNSRWQISVNWILSKYECFVPVSREPTPEDDGVAYRVLEASTFQTLIYPVSHPKRLGPQTVEKHHIVPLYPFLPIDFGESIGELSFKPNRPSRQRRILFITTRSLPLSTKKLNVLDLEDDNCSFSSSADSVSSKFWDVNSNASSERSSLYNPELRPATATYRPDVDLTHLMIHPTGRLGDEFTLRPICQENMEIRSLPLLSNELRRLKRSWPDPELDEPPVVNPPWNPQEPSLWTQCLLFENIKRGSDRLAKRKLAGSIVKKAHIMFSDDR